MSFDDTLKNILEENRRNNVNINTLPSLQQENTYPKDGEGLGTWLGAAGIGAGNMINNTVFGGLGGRY